MLFHIHCVDKPGHQAVRAENRDAHIAYLNAHDANLFTAGPMTTADGSGMIGSVLIMDFPDRPAAEAFAAGDPYAKAGLFESVTISPWKRTFFNPPSE